MTALSQYRRESLVQDGEGLLQDGVVLLQDDGVLRVVVDL